MKSIVINREYGSGGIEIGKLLAKELNMPFYDSEILLQAAEKHGINPGIMKDCDEKLIGSLLYNIAALVSQNNDAMKLPYKMYEAIGDIIRDSAMKEPCIFIGRCADNILLEKDIPFINVYIYASNIEDKRKRAIEVDKISSDNVDSYIAKKDKMRAQYQKFFTNTVLGKCNEYHMCLDSSKLGYDGCVKAIKSILEI